MNEEQLSIEAICEHCKSEHIIIVKTKDKKAWEDGAMIQDVLHYLTSGERELLIRQTCDDCFNKFYPN